MTGVLVTRPELDAQTLMTAIRSLGMTPYHAPMMAIHFLPPPALPLPEDISALAATSANGIRAVSALTSRRDIPVFAVGPTTARVAQEAGFPVAGIADGHVDSLARLLSARLGPAKPHRPQGPVYYPAGAREAGDLLSMLTAYGVRIRKDILYEARPLAHLPPQICAHITSGAIKWVTALSPLTAQYLGTALDQAGLHKATSHLCAATFSEAIADALRPGFLGRIYVADAPKISHLIDILTADIH